MKKSIMADSIEMVCDYRERKLSNDEDERNFCLLRDYITTGNAGLGSVLQNMENCTIDKYLRWKGNNGMSLLHLAVLFSNKYGVEQLLQYGADVNLGNDNDKKPLHYAETVDIAKLLIDYGANVNEKDKNGNTLLCTAYLLKNFDLVHFLLQNKADFTYVKEFCNLPSSCSEKEFYNIMFYDDIDPSSL